ncbi:MAG: glycosyltransferase [Xenococcaceae cyanobacterium MO_167.B52]|nr:glycosyltransferase [Xenococcaceae cyanobacterium MO_167.B52]
MKKIAIFLADLEGGGAERVMFNLACGFVQEGLRVDLILAFANGPYLNILPPEIKIIDLAAKKLSLSVFSLSNYLKKERPDVFISALEDTNIIAILASKLAKINIKVMVTVHNNLVEESLNAATIKRKLVPYLIRWIYPLADYVVAVSCGVATSLKRLGIQSNQIHTIYNPIVTSNFKQKAQETIQHQWFVNQHTPIILGVGRLEPQKDFATLIKAFFLVRKKEAAKLIILGEGSQYSYLTSLARKLDLSKEDVSFPGFVDNPYAYMKRASILVMSSVWEGFGNVIVEAMAVGTPVVATDCPSGPAEILEQGKYGALVPVGDATMMAEAIIATLQNPPERELLIERGRKFSLEAAIYQYRKLLNL